MSTEEYRSHSIRQRSTYEAVCDGHSLGVYESRERAKAEIDKHIEFLGGPRKKRGEKT